MSNQGVCRVREIHSLINMSGKCQENFVLFANSENCQGHLTPSTDIYVNHHFHPCVLIYSVKYIWLKGQRINRVNMSRTCDVIFLLCLAWQFDTWFVCEVLSSYNFSSIGWHIQICQGKRGICRRNVRKIHIPNLGSTLTIYWQIRNILIQIFALHRIVSMGITHLLRREHLEKVVCEFAVF